MKKFKSSHSTIVDGKRYVWDVERLWRLAEGLKVFEIDPLSIKEIDEDCWYGGTKTPTIANIIDHVRRIENCSFDHPIILNANGDLMDGGHHVAKAILQKAISIKAVQFAVMLAPDNIQET